MLSVESSSSNSSWINNECQHPLFMDNNCTSCGAPNDDGSIKTIALGYVCQGMSLCLEEIKLIRDMNLKKLLSVKKLRLVLDLDHTLVHSISLEKLTPHDQEYLHNSGLRDSLKKEGKLYEYCGTLTKLRPYVRTFLKEASAMFDLSIYTMGSRDYGRIIVGLLDPEGHYFNSQLSVISREDCTTAMKKGLDVVLSHERVVVVVDDTEEVWDNNPRNLIKIAPYNYFGRGSGGLNLTNSNKSWSQLKGDESEKCGELMRVLRVLRKIHTTFFESKGAQEDLQDYYESRDVRDVVDEVKRAIDCES